MKCLLDKHAARYIRVADQLANRLVNRENKRFSYVAKWFWKLQEDLPYRGKRLES
jgi:hypothetical protein